ncbi:MAG: hypothetical protein K6G22_00130 [Lachnospiraceae bacterium]|nr:hypothetical protein [Lachnospiraceae bacterium]
MFDLVPSNYMRELFEKTGFELTGFNKATLIWNIEGKTHAERVDALKELSYSTKDKELKKQISERIQYDENMLERLKDNLDRKCVYVVNDSDGYSFGFFADYSVAYEYGKKYCNQYEEKLFSISKQMIISENDSLIVKNPVRTNWYMFDDVETEENKYCKYQGDPVSKAYYADDGELRRVWSNEMTEEEDRRVDPFRRDRFEHQFFKIPFEGKLGMPVREINTGMYGILMNDTKTWDKYMRDIDERNLYVDYSDIQVVVVFLKENGHWSHEHINPIFLEVERPSFDYDDKKSLAYRAAFNLFSEYWIDYCGAIGDNKEIGKKAIEAAKRYRDVCIEVEKESDSDFPEDMDDIEKIMY